MRFAGILGLFGLTLAIGCSASEAPDGPEGTGSGEDEIRTADCPEAFTLAFAKPEIYSRTPTKYLDGSTLTSADRTRVESAMTEARRFKKQSLSFALKSKANAKCSYESTVSSGANAPKAVLRGTTAKPLLDVTYGAFRYYAFPKTIAPAGLAFAKSARIGVFSQVGASGVKIGSAAIGAASSPPPPPPNGNGGSIADIVAELESEAVLPGPARDDDYAVTGSTPLEMVKSYIKAKYADDPEIGGEYTYKENAAGLSMDEEVAGTLTSSVAVAESVSSIASWYDNADDGGQSSKTKAKAALDKLVAAGAQFGFDGFEQNGCAAPTAFLLVIDAPNKHVYGVDLNPCEE